MRRAGARGAIPSWLLMIVLVKSGRPSDDHRSSSGGALRVTIYPSGSDGRGGAVGSESGRRNAGNNFGMPQARRGR
jgi:hypothetical protein